MLCLDAYKICSEVQIAMKIEKPYPHLFQPLVVRGKKFRNRIISSPTMPHPIPFGPGPMDMRTIPKTPSPTMAPSPGAAPLW